MNLKTIKWKSISELNKLNRLEEIRMRANPLNQSESQDSVRLNIIARIAGIQIVNRTPLEDGRRGAQGSLARQEKSNRNRLRKNDC